MATGLGPETWIDLGQKVRRRHGGLLKFAVEEMTKIRQLRNWQMCSSKRSRPMSFVVRTYVWQNPRKGQSRDRPMSFSSTLRSHVACFLHNAHETSALGVSTDSTTIDEGRVC